MDKSLQLRAYAKVNLGLDVIGVRDNGYHDVRMIMQTVKLFDKLTFRLLEEDAIRIKTNLGFLPINEDNLVYRAVKLLKDTYNISKGLEIDLYKCIPVAAGMAGGSTDCAAALIGASKLFELHLDKKTLMELGVTLGADVPYCILRGTALSEGIGEILTPLSPIPNCYFLIAKPPISVSTKYVYETLDSKEIESHPDIDGMLKAIENNDLTGITSHMENVLETVTVEKYPVIQTIKEKMLDMGAMNAIMSGSGPTVFGIFEKEEAANAAKLAIKQEKLANQVYVVQPFNQNPPVNS